MANERRLIDANALVAKLELLARHEDGFRQSAILGVVETIKRLPTVDAVEVCYCKDCRWRGSENCAMYGVRTARIIKDVCGTQPQRENG